MTGVALLRAVNLSGRNMVSMAALRDLLLALGFEDVRTLLQSGNVVFRASRRATSAVETQLQAATAARFGVTTDYIVRTAAEWQAMIQANPFPREAARDASRLLVTALKAAPSTSGVAALQSAIVGRETLQVLGRHAYTLYPDGIGRSRLTIALLEKHLATRGTSRNWNTVLKIAEAMDAL